MLSALRWMVLWLTCTAAACQAVPARAEEGCTPLKWDVARERVLFAGVAKAVAAGGDVAAAPALVPDELYELTLKPQQQLTPAAPLGKKARPEGAFAGIARVHIGSAGVYRVSLALPGWIDVIAEQGVLTSTDFAGGGCGAPHKVVQFALPSGDIVLQLSGVRTDKMPLTVTRAP